MDLPSKTYLQECRKASPRTVTRNCELWFNAVYETQVSAPKEPLAGPIEAGKIYTYVYDAKYADELIYWDSFPMFLCMGHLENGNILGINLSFIPPRIRLRVIDKFVRVFHTRFIKPNLYFLEKSKPGAMKEIPFFYDIAKSMLAGSGFEHAIRSYRYDHIYTTPKIISYEEYWRLLAFASHAIQKLNIRAVYVLYHRQPNPTYRVGKQHPEYPIDKRVRPIQKQVRERKPRT